MILPEEEPYQYSSSIVCPPHSPVIYSAEWSVLACRAPVSGKFVYKLSNMSSASSRNPKDLKEIVSASQRVGSWDLWLKYDRL